MSHPFLDAFGERIVALDAALWQPFAMPIILVFVGGLLTFSTGFVQFRHFGTAVKMVFSRAAVRPADGGDGATITPFQALSTALAATVGNGNIGGVATAILLGGPGAIFWMWVCAAVGMATKYSEAVLGVHFRAERHGQLASGPMYYIARGLKGNAFGKVLAWSFAFFGMCTALFGTGNMAQANTIARTVVEAARTNFGVELAHWLPGIVVTTLVGLVLVGGIRRIAVVTETIVPTMIVLYVIAGLSYVVMNAAAIPEVFAMIVESAFSPSAAVGGFAGATVSGAIAAGMSRGVLSNEAGLGSAPIAHGIARVDHPVQQGVVGIFEVFVDTIAVCSMTAFIILSSGLWTDPSYQAASGDLTAAALNTSVPGAPMIVALCSFLFGFSTLLGWSYYGEKCFEYLFGERWIRLYRVLFTALIMVGAVASVPIVWAIGTLLNGFMAFPNLVGLLVLAGTVGKLTRDYFKDGRRTSAG